MGQRYKLFIPKQSVGADLVYWDMFNADGSGVSLHVHSVLPVVSGAEAVSGVLGVDLHLTYTSTVGTGGTAATANGTDKSAATISALTPAASALNAAVTARLTPSGGATAGALLSYASVFTEETNGGSYVANAAEMVARNKNSSSIVVPEGAGIRVVQGAIASVGKIGFEVEFETIPYPN